MREWLKILIGVSALVAAPTIPALYAEYLWVISREHDRSRTATEDYSTQHDQGNSIPSPAPAKPDTAERNPVRSAEKQSSNSEMKFTDWLLVFVGFLQFFAIVGQIIIYCRQANIMNKTAGLIENQLQDMRTFQRAYLSVEPMGIEPLTGFAASISSGLIGIRNSGNLPATNVKWAIQIQFMTDNRWRTPKPSKEMEGDNIITPGAIMRQGSDPIVFAYENFEEFRTSYYIYVYGRVSYAEGFTSGRWTDFCHRYNCINIVKPMGDHRIAAGKGRYHRFGNATG